MVTKKHKQSGFSLTEVVVAIGILAVLASSITPILTRVDIGEKVDRVKKKLEKIKVALEEYHYENKAFPSTSTSTIDFDFSSVLTHYIADNTNNSTVRDDFSPTKDYFQFASSASAPYTVYVWSVGEDGTDDTHATSSDDIYVEVQGEVPGRRRTRQQLNIISRYYAKYTVTHAIATTAWVASSYRATLGLGTEFDYDGWGVAFYNGSFAVNYTFYSWGPNKANNSGLTDDMTF